MGQMGTTVFQFEIPCFALYIYKMYWVPTAGLRCSFVALPI
jgi:hypothetical protein